MRELSYEQKMWLRQNDLTSRNYKILDVATTVKLRKKWKSSFIPNLKESEILHKCHVCSTDDKRSYNWHAFSYKEVVAKKVESNFLQKKLKFYKNDLYLVWEECNTHGLIISSRFVKDCRWTNTDIYIFDNSFKWTFVVTHEEWYYYKEM